MNQTVSVFESWALENNEVVNKCRLSTSCTKFDKCYRRWLLKVLQEGGKVVFSQDGLQTQHLKWCSSEFHKLLKKIQGLPPDADHARLELSVVFNVCLCFTARSQFSEAELLLTQALERVVHITGGEGDTSEPCVRWRTVLISVGNTTLQRCVLHLLCLQWALWLATCQLKRIQDVRGEMLSQCETLCGGAEDGSESEAEGTLSTVPLLMMEPRRLVELLQICTSIVQGAESLSEGRSAEALSGLQTAATLPAPKALVAYTHLLSGACLTRMSCPQMALRCYRKALETDPGCVCALYRSMLVYKQQGNTQAEIQALRLLHQTLVMPSAAPHPAPAAATPSLSPSLFLSSQSLTSLLSVPSALGVLHSLAHKCLLHGRVSEGVEHYLDLLAAIHSEDQQRVPSQGPAEVHTVPRLPELYLEAAAALLMAQRPADCQALCSEVISTTMELLPERVVLEEPEERNGPETGDTSVRGEDNVAMLLWTAAAFLLQGHSHTHLKEWKQAVTHYTRCINLLIKVHFKKRGVQPQIPTADLDVQGGKILLTLQRLKGLSLAGRGVSFTHTDQLKEALRDLQLSLQAFPEGVGSGLWCGEVLWRLSRRQEAAACWEKTWSITPECLDGTFPVYLQELQSGASLDSTELRHRIQELGPTSVCL